MVDYHTHLEIDCFISFSFFPSMNYAMWQISIETIYIFISSKNVVIDAKIYLDLYLLDVRHDLSV